MSSYCDELAEALGIPSAQWEHLLSEVTPVSDKEPFYRQLGAVLGHDAQDAAALGVKALLEEVSVLRAKAIEVGQTLTMNPGDKRRLPEGDYELVNTGNTCSAKLRLVRKP